MNTIDKKSVVDGTDTRTAEGTYHLFTNLSVADHMSLRENAPLNAGSATLVSAVHDILGLGHRCVQIVERRSLSACGTGKMPILLDATMTVAIFSNNP